MIWEQDCEPLPMRPSRGGQIWLLDSAESLAGAIDRPSSATQYG